MAGPRSSSWTVGHVVATVVIRGGALALHGIAPLSALVVVSMLLGDYARYAAEAAGGHGPGHGGDGGLGGPRAASVSAAWRLLQVWAVLEVAFYGYFRWRHARAQRTAPVQSGMTAAQRTELLRKCTAVVDDGNAFLSGWFQGHPAQEIPFGNAQHWLAWAFFEAEWDALSPAEQTEVDTLLHHFEQHAGIAMPAGFNAALKPIRLTLDSVHAIHKPLVYYAALALAHGAFVLWMRAHGGQRARAGRLAYWYFAAPAAVVAAAPDAPIVFFHGMGVGPGVYLQLLVELLRLRVPLYIVELPHISSQLSHTVPSRQQILASTEEMLRVHGHRRAVIVGHSMGSVYAGWVVKHRPELVHGVVFIDPVVFLLCHPDVAFNFVYRQPTQLSEWAIHLFVSTELSVALTLHRHFVWTDNILWASELASPTLVVLSEQDAIVPAVAVRDYLQRAIATGETRPRVPVDVWMIPNTGHAGFLLQPSIHLRLADYLRTMIRPPAATT